MELTEESRNFLALLSIATEKKFNDEINEFTKDSRKILSFQKTVNRKIIETEITAKMSND